MLDLVQDDLQHDHVPNGGILQEIDFVEEDVRVRHEVVRVRAEVRVHQRGVGQRRVILGASRAALHATPHVVPQVVFPHHLDDRTLLGFLHQSFQCSTARQEGIN